MQDTALTQARDALEAGDPLSETELVTLLTRGGPEDWEALASARLHDRIAACFFDAPTPPMSDDPIARGAAWVLIQGFSRPRPGRALTDITRALEVLVGDGDTWFGLSTGEVEGHVEYAQHLGDIHVFYEAARDRRDVPLDAPGNWRHGHIALPAPILHPVLAERAAALLGAAPEATAALMAGEVYVEARRRLCLFPWYADEEAELRPEAEARAAALGVEMPPRHLDAPYESRFYLDRTGARALERILKTRAAELEPDFTGDLERALFIRHVPVPPLAARPPRRFPGGGVGLGAVSEALSALSRQCRYARWNLDDAGRLPPEYQTRVQLAVEGALRAEGALPPESHPPHPAWSMTLSPPEPGEEPAPDAPVLEAIRSALPGTALLVYPARLVLLELDTGAVRGSWPAWDPVVHVSAAGGVLLQGYQRLSLLDLRSGTWRTGTLAQARDAGLIDDAVFPASTGPLFGSFYDNSNAWLHDIESPDHRFTFTCDAEMIGGITRREDGLTVASPDAVLGEEPRWEEEEVEETPQLVSAAAREALRAASSASTACTMGGVTFLASSPDTHRVKRGHAVAFALHEDTWRSHSDGALRALGEPVARLDGVHAAAFSHDGARALLCDASWLHVIMWPPKGPPDLEAHLALDELLALFGPDAAPEAVTVRRLEPDALTAAPAQSPAPATAPPEAPEVVAAPRVDASPRPPRLGGIGVTRSAPRRRGERASAALIAGARQALFCDGLGLQLLALDATTRAIDVAHPARSVERCDGERVLLVTPEGGLEVARVEADAVRVEARCAEVEAEHRAGGAGGVVFGRGSRLELRALETLEVVATRDLGEGIASLDMRGDTIAAITEAREVWTLRAPSLEVAARFSAEPPSDTPHAPRVHVSSDGRWVAVTDTQRRVQLFDHGERCFDRRGNHRLTLDTLALMSAPPRLLSDRMVMSLEPVAALRHLAHTDLRLLDVTPDGARALYLERGAWLFALDLEACVRAPLPRGALEGNALALALSPSGRALAVGCDDTTVWVYALDSGEATRIETWGRAFGERALVFLDEERLAIAGNTAGIELWRWREPALEAHWAEATWDSPSFRALSLDRSAQRMLCVAHARATLRHLASGRVREIGPYTRNPHGYEREARFESAALHPEGTHIAVTLEYGEAPGVVLSLQTGEEAALPAVKQVAFHPSGGWLLVSESGRGWWERWPSRERVGAELPPWDQIAFAPGSGHAVWNHRRTFGWRPPGGDEDVQLLELHDDVSDMVMTPEDALITASSEGWVGLRSPEGDLQRVLPSARGERVTSMVATPAGDALVICDGGGRVALWDVASLERVSICDPTSLQERDDVEVGSVPAADQMRCTESTLTLFGWEHHTWPVEAGRPVLDRPPEVSQGGRSGPHVVCPVTGRAVVGNARGGALDLVEASGASRPLGRSEGRLDFAIFSPDGARLILVFSNEGAAGSHLHAFDAEKAHALGQLQVDHTLEGVAFEPGRGGDAVVLWTRAQTQGAERAVVARWCVSERSLAPFGALKPGVAALLGTQSLHPLGGGLALSDARGALPFVFSWDEARSVCALRHPLFSNTTPRALTVSPDAAWVAVGYFDGSAVIWDAQRWRPRGVICSARGGWWSVDEAGALREEGGRWTR